MTANLTELKFIRHLLDSLADGARCVVIVPQSTMVGKTNADKDDKRYIYKYYFVASDHVTHLRRNGLSAFQYLFMATMCVKQFSGKYNFNREITDPRIERENIMLPATPDGKPDFAYMDAFGREIMRNRLEKYLACRS